MLGDAEREASQSPSSDLDDQHKRTNPWVKPSRMTSLPENHWCSIVRISLGKSCRASNSWKHDEPHQPESVSGCRDVRLTSLNDKDVRCRRQQRGSASSASHPATRAEAGRLSGAGRYPDLQEEQRQAAVAAR